MIHSYLTDPLTIAALKSFFEYFNEKKLGDSSIDYWSLHTSSIEGIRWILWQKSALRALTDIEKIASYCGMSSSTIDNVIYEEFGEFSE